MGLEKYILLFIAGLSAHVMDVKIQKELLRIKNNSICSNRSSVFEYKDAMGFMYKYEEYKKTYNKKNEN
jgi:hypothetical protein